MGRLDADSVLSIASFVGTPGVLQLCAVCHEWARVYQQAILRLRLSLVPLAGTPLSRVLRPLLRRMPALTAIDLSGSGACDGDVQSVFVPSTSGAPLPPAMQTQEPVAPSPAPPGETTAQEPGEPPPASDAPPETVEELAKQTVEASGKGLKKAGEAVSDTAKSAGDAVSKTWKCLSSLFSDC